LKYTVSAYKIGGLNIIQVMLTCMTPPPLLPGEDAMNSSGSPIALPEIICICKSMNGKCSSNSSSI